MAKKLYAVRKGRTTGLFTDWASCQKSVSGYPGAEFKSFTEKSEAEAYLNGTAGERLQPESLETVAEDESLPYAFVDGSYNPATKVYGWGGFLYCDGERYPLQGSGDDTEMAEMRNVAGEIKGSLAAVEKAIELHIPELNIYYDYMGIEKWAVGEWKTNKTGTKAYREQMEKYSSQIKIHFKKVKGHSGVEGNEEADKLAKESVGIL